MYPAPCPSNNYLRGMMLDKPGGYAIVKRMKTAIGHPDPNKGFDAFYECAQWLAQSRPSGIRLGQFYFNHLHEQYPTLANHVRGRAWVDPFYDDKLIASFWAFVAENWALTGLDE